MAQSNNPMLNELLWYAKSLDNGSGNLSAERFLVVVLDVIDGNLHLKNPDRSAISNLRDQLKAKGIKASCRDTLMAQIRSKQSVLSDELYIRKALSQAGALATAKNEDTISAELLLECILEKPTQTITDILGGAAAPESQESSSFDILAAIRNASKQSAAPTQQAEPKAAEPKPQKQPADPGESKDAVDKLIHFTKEMQEKLLAVIYGQDNAVSTFTSGYFQGELSAMTDQNRKRPRATFLFAGPPGVGKTFLAEQGAKALGLPFARFDMSEYSDKEAIVEFCGSDKVYKDSKPGNVTEFIRKNPRCVLLFDEIEKAHIKVIYLFLQMLDAGRLHDVHEDEEISLKDTIIILTTNAGKQLYAETENADFSCLSRKVILKALERDVDPETNVPFFPAAICSRFATGNVVMFNHIGAHNLRNIAKKEIQRHAENFAENTGIQVRVDEDVYTSLLFAEGGSADARTICGRAMSFFNTELFELLRLMSSDRAGGKSIRDLKSLHITAEPPVHDEKLRDLFYGTTFPQALVFSDEALFSRCAARTDICSFLHAKTAVEAETFLRKQDIRFVLIDLGYGKKPTDTAFLNTEDMDSEARDFLRLAREAFPNIPVYLLQTGSTKIGVEERLSFLRMGVRDVIDVTAGDAAFNEYLAKICVILHQNDSMALLARTNRVIRFETAQYLSADGTEATIRLFDFKAETAVDAEDSGNILSSLSRPNICFDDVIGAEAAKKELQYFVRFLKDPKKYLETGVSAPKGVILHGPPGTGKTLLAKAMAGESEATFIAAEGNQFLQKWVGEGKERVHELFRTARKYAPTILFIDEIDAIAKERRGGENSAGSEDTLTAFLTEMDGFKNDPSKPVFVLAATNFDVEPGSGKSLDQALMRRFDRRILVDLPDKDARIRYLQRMIAKKPLFRVSQAQIDNLALRSTGMSLAALESVLQMAMRDAIREEQEFVSDEILMNAFETFNSGEEKKWDISQLERVARHEAGHAYLCWHSGETPSYLTIVARGNHGGYMQHGEREGKAIFTREELLANIRTSLGGRAAEILYYGPEAGLSTGASGDLHSATRTAQRLLGSYGMDEEFGLAVMDDVAAGSPLADRLHEAANELLEKEMARTMEIITAGKPALDKLVAVLMDKTSLTGPQIEEILKNA